MQDHNEHLVGVLAPILTVLYQIVEEGIYEARSFFDEHHEPYTPWLFAHIVRWHICRRLDERDGISIEYTRNPLAFDGIEIMYEGYSIKLLKADEGDLPGAATYTREAWYTGNLFELDEISVEVSNVAVLWDVNRYYRFTELTLVIPGSEEAPALIPHPATLPHLQEPQVNGSSRDLTEFEEPEDLDISEEDTGTEEV
jgi:hypothetical protein